MSKDKGINIHFNSKFYWLKESYGLTGAGDDNVHLSDDFVQFHQPEAVHAGQDRADKERDRTSNPRGHQNATRAIVSPGLQGTNGVNLCDVDNGAHRFEGGAAAFSHLGVIDKCHYKNRYISCA